MKYQIKALDADVTELLLYGPIGEDWWSEESNDARMIVSAIDAVDTENLLIRINSKGGSVEDGIAIHNAIARFNGKSVSRVESAAKSIASLIAVAADHREIENSAMIMVHAPWSSATGNAGDMRRVADVLDKYADTMTAAYSRNGKPDAETAKAWLTDGQDHYFTASEAIEAGLVDKIVGATARGELSIQANERVNNMTESNQVDVNEFASTRKKQIDQGRAEGVKAEKTRQAGIRALFDKPQFGDQIYADLRDELLNDENRTVESARAALIDLIGDGYAPITDQHQAPQAAMTPMPEAGLRQSAARVTHDQRDKIREGMVQATVARMGVEHQDGKNPWRGHSLIGLARDCLIQAGHSVFGMSDKAVAMQVLSLQTTSDFPIVLQDTMHKLVLMGFESAPGQWRKFCKAGSVSDLRDWKRITPGLLSDLEEQDEGGDYRAKPIPDGEAEAIAAKLIGNIIKITANVLINDDLSYIESRARGVGNAGERTIERKVWALLAANPTMSDGNALFSAAHGNIATGTPVPIGDPTIDNVDLMATALAEQKAPAAKDDPSPTDQYLDLVPYAAVAHRSRRAVLMVLNSDTLNITQAPEAATGTGQPFAGLIPGANPIAGMFAQIGTSVMAEAAPWYLFADPNVAPIVEVVFLNGQQTPEVTMEQDFASSGLRWKVELPHGVGAIGWRGAMKNPGA